MSRVKTLLIAIILVVGILFPTTTLASPEATVSITDAILPTGASGSVVLSISGATEPVSCVDVDVSYDPAVVEVTDASGSDFDSLVSNIESGHTHLVAFVTSPTGLTGTIKVADITLTRLGGESELALDVITLKDDDGNSIPFAVDNGWVAVAAVTGQKVVTVPAGQTDYVVDASDIADTTITVDTTGEVTITVKKYDSNPHPGATLPADTSMLPRYIDIEVDDPGAIDWPMYVEQTYTQDEVAGLDEFSLGMCYFTADPLPDGAWHRCSNTGVNTAANYVWAYIEEDELPGSPVAIGGTAPVTPPPPAAGGGGGGGGGPPPGTTYVRGMVTSVGRFLMSITADSEDRICRLTIPAGTVGLTEELAPLFSITMLIMDEPPPPPEGAHIIGLVYDFQPSGVTFEPPIILTFSYDPDDIPDGVAEEDLVLAYYDQTTGEWVELEGTVDPRRNTITVSISHLTAFTIIGAVPLPPPPPPVPAAFSVSNLSVKPAEVQPREAVTISVSVANTGGTEGSYSLVLEINGVKEAEKSVTVAAGSSQDITFSVTRDKAASYSVAVDGLSASFTVVAPPPAPPAWIEENGPSSLVTGAKLTPPGAVAFSHGT